MKLINVGDRIKLYHQDRNRLWSLGVAYSEGTIIYSGKYFITYQLDNGIRSSININGNNHELIIPTLEYRAIEIRRANTDELVCKLSDGSERRSDGIGYSGL